MRDVRAEVQRAPQKQPHGTEVVEGAAPGGGELVNPILALQQTVGNQAVQRQVRTGTLPPGVILGHQRTLGNQAVQRLLQARALQAKLTAPAASHAQDGDPAHDDAGSEREADVMGAQPLQRRRLEAAAPGAGEEAGRTRRRTGATGAASMGRLVGDTVQPEARPGVVQRTIHQYNAEDGDWEIAEEGTEGRYELPDNGDDGEFFNDVTGLSGETIDSVRAGLVDQMMVTGSLEGTEHLEVTWRDLAKDLSTEAGKAMKRSVSVSPLFLGEMYMRWNKEKENHSVRLTVKPGIDKDIVDRTSDFVVDFMSENGQIPYIERQDWYTSGAYEVHIDLNFYYDREMGEVGLGMHKDTGGDNLFVNLIFNNEEETPATEWTQDREAAKGVKAETMARLLPPDMIKAINDAKQKLGTEAFAKGEETIEGGTLPPLGFVSWVDELIWHSTPSLANRTQWDSKVMVDYLEKHWNNKEHEENRKEAVFTMSEKEGTLVHAERKKIEAQGKAFDWATWDKIERALTDEGWSQLWKDIRAFDWGAVKWSGRSGNELDVDKRTSVSEQSHIPTPITGRERSNSDAAILQVVKEAAQKQPRRSFIRTWVRVVKAPKDKV